MASPLSKVYSGIDAAKRKAAAMVQGMQDVGPVEMLRQYGVNKSQEAEEASSKLGQLYRDPSGQPTFDPNRWSPTAKAVHDELVDEATGAVMGATAWHGTPWKFDKFDPSKIGTGEGQQVYGQGLYLAESPGVAKDYRRNLSRRQVANEMSERYEMSDSATEAYYDFMRDPKIPLDQKRFMARMRQEDWLGYDSPSQGISNALDKRSGHQIPETLSRASDNLGHLYKVDVPDPHIAQMVDWDKPLYQQQGLMGKLESASNDPDKVSLRKTLDLLGKETDVRTGETLMRALPFSAGAGKLGTARGKMRQASVDIANDLQASGVPGVKYLDQMSRDPRRTNKTSNYVVFPEYQNDLTILQRNNQQLVPQEASTSALIDALRAWK